MHEDAGQSHQTAGEWDNLPTVTSSSELERFGLPDPIVRDQVKS